MSPRHFTFNPQASMEVHIDELVVYGLPLTDSQGRLVQAAVEAELARLLGQQGLSYSDGSGNAHLLVGSIQLARSNQPMHLGQQIAQAVYGGLAGTSNSPHQNHSMEGISK